MTGHGLLFLSSFPMALPADFVEAHRRHWRDAELLFAESRWANADQLYGFSAECGMKAVMVAAGMPLTATGDPEQQYRQHVQKLWPLCFSFLNGRQASRYLSLLPSTPPFSDWSHHDRYAADGHFTDATTKPHRLGAEGVVRMVRSAQQDGVL